MREEAKATLPSRFPGDLKLKLAVVIIATSTIAAAFPALATAQADAEHRTTALRKRVEAYQRVWNTHDAAAVAAFFTEDADFVMGNLPLRRGREEIRNWWRDYFARQEPERGLTLLLNSVRFVAADVAVINVATTTGGRDRLGQELPARRFRGTWVLRRQSGIWLVSAMRGLPTEEDRVVLNPSVDAAEALRPQIRAVVDAYEDAFNSHDPPAVSAFYRSDADIIVRNGPVTHGREAIQDWWQAYFSEPRPYRAILIIDAIRMITPDVALLNVIATGAALEKTDQLVPIRQARATWVLVREDGEWLIAALRVLPSEHDRIIRESGR